MKKYDIKATFFIEQLEVEAIISRGEKAGSESVFYLEAQLLKKQIHHMVLEGHDLQLHLHPQWYDAQYNHCDWDLNYNWWRFSSLPFRHQNDGTPGRYDLLCAGKKYLEDLIRPIKSGYECIAFRAGGYNIGLDDITDNALIESGFKIDSSVCPGFYVDSELSRYDFSRQTNFKPAPFLSSSTKKSQVIEYPLVTLKSNFFKRISTPRIYTKLINNKFKNINCSGLKVGSKHVKPHCLKNIKNSNFDVCLSSRLQINDFLQQIKNSKSSHTVLIGHPKDYSVFSPFEYILRKLDGEFITFSEVQEVI